MCFPRLVVLVAFDFLRTDSTWRRDPMIQPTSMMQELVSKLGSVFPYCIFADGAPSSDTIIVAQRPGR